MSAQPSLPLSRSPRPLCGSTRAHDNDDLPWGKLKMPHAGFKMPRGTLNLPWCRLKMPWGKLRLPWGKLKMPWGKLEFPRHEPDLVRDGSRARGLVLLDALIAEPGNRRHPTSGVQRGCRSSV